MPAKKPSRAEQVLRLAKASPGITTAEAASILGISSANLGGYASQLRKQGLLEKTRGTLQPVEEADLQAGAGQPQTARSTATHGAAPAEQASPSKKSGKKAGAGKKSGSYKKPKLTKKQNQRLIELVQEGARRAESYRQEGVLNNIILVSRDDGSKLVVGVGGSAAFSLFMLGGDDPSVLAIPEFQAMMQRFLNELGEPDDGMMVTASEMMVIFNLTEIGSEEDQNMQAVMSAWLGGHRVMCAAAPIDDQPLAGSGMHQWVDLTDKQAAKLAAGEFKRLRAEKKAAQEDPDDLEDPDNPEIVSLQPARILEAGPWQPEDMMRVMGHVMADLERRPQLIFELLGDEAAGGTTLAMRRLDSSVADQLAAAGLADDERPSTSAVGNPNEVMRTAGEEALAAEKDWLAELILRACRHAEEQRQSGQFENFMEILMTDGEFARGKMKAGEMMDLMTGKLDDKDAEAMLAGFTGGQGLAIAFVNIEDCPPGERRHALLSCWMDNQLVVAMSIEVRDQSLELSARGWTVLDAAALLRIGDAASHQSSTQQAEPAVDDYAQAIADIAGQLPATSAQLPVELREVFAGLPLGDQLVVISNIEPGIKFSKAAKFLNLPKDQVKAEAGVLMDQEMLKRSRSRLEPWETLPDSVAVANEAAPQAPAADDAQPEDQSIELRPLINLVGLACAYAEQQRLDGSRSDNIEIGLADGSVTRVGMSGGQMLPMMSGLFGDQLLPLIESFSQGQGCRAVFMAMMDLEVDGQEQVLCSAWEGNIPVVALQAVIGDQSLEIGSPAWSVVPADELLKMGEAAQAVMLAEAELDQQDD
jgi:hypothetical protein